MDKPSAVLLRHVTDYWERVRALACEHREITIEQDEHIKCSSCNRPLQILSDVQIEDLIKKSGGR